MRGIIAILIILFVLFVAMVAFAGEVTKFVFAPVTTDVGGLTITIEDYRAYCDNTPTISVTTSPKADLGTEDFSISKVIIDAGDRHWYCVVTSRYVHSTDGQQESRFSNMIHFVQSGSVFMTLVTPTCPCPLSVE